MPAEPDSRKRELCMNNGAQKYEHLKGPSGSTVLVLVLPLLLQR
jgi:hypothetical protein